MPLNADFEDLIEHHRDRARRLLLEMADAMPASVEAQMLLSASYIRSLEIEPALETFTRVLALQPAHSGALHGLAFCRLSLGDLEGALQAYQQAFTATASASSYGHIGLMLHRLGRLDEAVHCYRRVLQTAQPTSNEILHTQWALMRALRDAGALAEADACVAELTRPFDAQPYKTASNLIVRHQSTSYREWFVYVDKAKLTGLLKRGVAAVAAPPRIPATCILPDDRAELVAAARTGGHFIVKPKRGSGGQGISIVRDLSGVIDRDDVIVQRYIDRPYLVDGRKCHLRVYGLVTSVAPLRLYFYSEGLARFAPAVFDLAPASLADPARHVTNTALHTGHPGLVISEDPSVEDQGAIWSMSALLRRVARDGHDAQKTFNEIAALVRWFVLVLRETGLFARQAAESPGRSYAPKLFGLDVLLDAGARPWLIEMQSNPGSTGAPLVNRINGDMYATMFRMSVGALGVAGEAGIDPAELIRREQGHEMAHRGRFVPLNLD